MKRMSVVAVIVASAGCATSGQGAAPGVPAGVTFDGGGGLSCETRIVIRGAAGETEGIAAEHAWLRAHYPHHKLKRQGLAECQQHASDIMSIATSDGREIGCTSTSPSSSARASVCRRWTMPR
jgi:hypothetical protein